MIYSKDKINRLFLEYQKTKSDETLWELVQQCSPLVDAIVGKYKDRFSLNPIDVKDEIQDIKQNILFKLYTNLRKDHKMKKPERQAINPYVYLFFLIRAYSSYAIKRLRLHYETEIPFSQFDTRALRELVGAFYNLAANPELTYMVRDEIRIFYLKCKEGIENDPSLANYPTKRKKKILFLRKSLCEIFQLDIEDEESK